MSTLNLTFGNLGRSCVAIVSKGCRKKDWEGDDQMLDSAGTLL